MKAESTTRRAANRRRFWLPPSAFRHLLSARLLTACLLALAMPLCNAGSANAAQKTGRQPGPVVMTPQANQTSIASFSASSPPSFSASDPDAGAVAGSPNVTVGWNTSQGSQSSTWALYLYAGGSVFSGGSACSAVPASAVTVSCVSATASGNGTASCSGSFTLSTGIQQIAGGQESTGNSRNFSAIVSFRLADSWRYVSSICTLSVTYSLNAP